MRALEYRDHRADPDAWARELGIAREAVEVYLSCEVVDLHTCSFVWTRSLPGYDLAKRHRPRLPHSAFLNQFDLPRAREAQLAGVCFDIPTNPFRRRKMRPEVTRRNITRIRQTLARFPGDFAPARTLGDYRRARAEGRTAGFIALQGGDALDDSLEEIDRAADWVHRITLVELTESRIGVPNRKQRKSHAGLTPFGREFVQRMQANRILVDLSHLNRRGFFDALGAGDRSVPMVVTHTGLNALCPLWRNIDDDQIRAIAERGGTVGIVFHRPYLSTGSTATLGCLVDHVEHVIRVAGEDYVSLGSDFDGMIRLPDGFRDVTHMPKLVAVMLERGWSAGRVAKVMGENFLRVVGTVQP